MAAAGYLCTRIVLLLAAAPWQALLINARVTANAPARTASTIASNHDDAVITTAPAERKPVARGERAGPGESISLIAERAPVVAARAVSSAGKNTFHTSRVNHPRCALLCRFLI